MPALASLKRFAGSRNGKLVLGGTAAGGVVVAGLVTRSRSGGGDPSAALIPYSEVQGTSGVNSGAFPSLEGTGVTVGELEALYNQVGAIADRVDKLADPSAAPPAPAPQEYTTSQKQAIGKYIVEQGTPEQKAALKVAVGNLMQERAQQQASYSAAITKALRRR